MKRIFSSLLLMVSVTVVAPMFTSCGDDDPETPENTEDQFSDMYGYWLNTDNSCALEIKEWDAKQCVIKSYVYTSSGLKEYKDSFRGDGYALDILSPDGNITYAWISTSTYNKIVLRCDKLSSCIFNRVDEGTFFNYLENGGSSSEPSDELKKLIGTWTGKFMSTTFTITFYSSGKAKEEWSDGYDRYDTQTVTGTYEFSNGKITSWEMESPTLLPNILGECPWSVSFNSSTSITIGPITFTKK